MATFAEYMARLEQERGLPTGFLATTRQIESGGGRNLASPLSSARGDFQFIGKTANAYGVNVNDPYSGARGAADYAADNSKLFQRTFNRTPTGADLYGMHQQGPKGYIDLTRGILPSAKALANNGGAGMTAAQFQNKLAGLYSRKAQEVGVDPGIGPTQAAAGAANAPLPGAQGPTLPTAAANPVAATPPAERKYTGGLLGLLNDGYTGPGAAKDTMGKVGDLLNSSAYSTAAKGLVGALGGGQQSRPAPQIIPTDPELEHKPNMSLLDMLRMQGMGA